MEQAFCPTCLEMSGYTVESRREIFTVRGELIEVDTRVAVCDRCGGDIGLQELDDSTFRDAYSIYRARHDLLQPDQIREIRAKYGLGQKAFARLLGWGDVTLARYETGSLQSEAHDVTLRLVEDPQNVRRLLDLNRDKLSADQVAAVEARLAELALEHGAVLAREAVAAYGDKAVRVSAEQAQRDFSQILDRVSHGRERVILTRDDADVAAIVPIEELQMLDAAMALLKAHPQFAHMMETIEDTLVLSPESYDTVVGLIEHSRPATAALRKLMHDEP